jgi:hypothetical protein
MLFFVDESGTEREGSPYVVLACVSIREDKVWPLALAQRRLKQQFLTSFEPAMTRPQESQEPKSSDLLRKQAFKLAGPRPWLSDEEIESLVARARSKKGMPLDPRELTAANQGKIRYAEEVLDLCRSADMRVFATVTEKNAPAPRLRDFLGKDFSFLFQRIYAYLDQEAREQHGILVFDERDDAFCKSLIDQMHRYFSGTVNGQIRAARIVPTPFFARSHLMPALEVADLVAYIVNWAFRAGPALNAPKRDELVYLALKIKQMQFEGTRVDRFAVTEVPLWGIQYIRDPRPRSEQDGDEPDLSKRA